MIKPTSFLASALLLALPALSKPCEPGSPCVSYYSGQGCAGTQLLGSYVPTCQGNCFQYSSFSSIRVQGNGIYGTNCEAFSDSNCAHSLGSTGNTVFGNTCKNFPGAQSMKCYFHC